MLRISTMAIASVVDQLTYKTKQKSEEVTKGFGGLVLGFPSIYVITYFLNAQKYFMYIYLCICDTAQCHHEKNFQTGHFLYYLHEVCTTDIFCYFVN
jgi:hypothetical protein